MVWSGAATYVSATPQKGLHFFLPEDTDEEDKETDGLMKIDSKKLLGDISREMRKVVKDELESVTCSLEFINSQLADLENVVKQQDNTIKMLVNKNTDLVNKNKNLELRIAAVEQRAAEVDQKLLASTVEIAGLPETPNQNVLKVAETVAAKLKVECQQIVSARRLYTRRKDRPGPVIVEMSSKAARDQWISSSRNQQLHAGHIFSDLTSENAASRIYIRPALTQHTKSLLYNAKQRLGASYKYVWCKEGKIYVKKDEDSKQVNIVRSLSDIESLC